jgi:hypothetical protein
LGLFGAHAIVLLPTTQEGSLSLAYGRGWDGGEHVGLRAEDRTLILDIPHAWRGGGEGKTRLLHDDWLAVHGTPYIPRQQGKAPSCVGQAVAAGVDFLAAVEINSLRHPERAPPARAAASVIYGLSRQEIGKKGRKKGGGSHNLWGVQAIQKYGVVAQLRYPMLGIDLRKPSPAQCVLYGMNGIPTGLEYVARLHPVKEYIAIDSYEELRDAIVMGGCPVAIGSSQGFGDGNKLRRDSEGFLNPPGRRWWKSVWKHSMICIGVSDEGRKGALMLNSWGTDWISGPNRFPNTPEGCFFVDAKIINKMVKQGDSYAIRGFRGYASYQIWSPR